MNSFSSHDAFLEQLLALKAWILSNVFIRENLVRLPVRFKMLLAAREQLSAGASAE